MKGAVLARRLDGDLHGLEVPGIGRAGHGEGPVPAGLDDERAGRYRLAAVAADVPAFVPPLRADVLEVTDGQGDVPAAGGILAGRRRTGRRGSRLSRSLGRGELEGEARLLGAEAGHD